jgi:hypothetical protein
MTRLLMKKTSATVFRGQTGRRLECPYECKRSELSRNFIVRHSRLERDRRVQIGFDL